MFTDFFRRLTAPSPAPLPPLDARRALGALLVRIAKSDNSYAVEEIARIDRILASRFGLNPVEAARLRAECEAIEREAPDTVRFTRAIKEAVAYEDRAGVIEALWDVVLADGVRDADENALLRMVAPMLGVSDQDSARARHKVEALRGLPMDRDDDA
ncbi:MAG: TerB family tellurite resistance protein [Rhodobacterales bacterium]|nr:TerB family tellurite resistance protein [Rhodobacterales bacterium]NCT12886.1 TerB family tellurite resistance protein [Rhodobacterales bacterium]